MDRIATFAARVDDLVRGRAADSDPGPDLVLLVARLLEPLVSHRGWLAAETSVPVPGKPYSQYLLHLSPDCGWSLVSFVWPAGSSTPVHDHGCWGVVGVYQGEETEIGFLVAGDREAGPVTLEPGSSRTMRPGDVATLLPPDDVHRVSNEGDGTAISIHVYGSDIGRMRRHSFDPATGNVTPFVSGYDRPRSSSTS
jgi:3-mercaptopropionate dioxygenase